MKARVLAEAERREFDREGKEVKKDGSWNHTFVLDSLSSS
jgi:hypothetical protein